MTNCFSRAWQITALFLALAGLAAAQPAPSVVFFGDSLTAGYGLDPDQAYPALLGERMAAAGLPHRAVNAGLSGETTAGGLRRVDWILRQPVDVFVLALGGNDGLRGIPVEETRRNLSAILARVRARYPGAALVLAGMQMSPTLGPDYTAAYRSIFPAVAAEHGAVLVPFLLEGVGGVPELNQADGIHPNPTGQRILADNVWAVLRPLLEARAAAAPRP